MLPRKQLCQCAAGTCPPGADIITLMVNKSAAPADAAGRGARARGKVREQLLVGRPGAVSALRLPRRVERQIGAAAGVNFAMIRYYFGGKPGLYREILQGLVPPEIAGLDAMQVGRGGAKLADILSNITRVWQRTPGSPASCCAKCGARGPDAHHVLREFPERLAPIVERALRAERSSVAP